MPRAKGLVVPIACVVLIAFVNIDLAHRGRRDLTPLGDSPLIEFPTVPISQAVVQQFLDDDFRFIKDTKALPKPVIQAFTETGGSRLTIANPGKEFEETDVIWDASVPRKRLLFAGVSRDKCFMLYEQGGRVHFYVLALFELSNANVMKPVWAGYCGPAASIAELRSNVSRDRCHDPFPQVWQ